MSILAFIEVRGRASAQAMRVGNCSTGHICLDLMLQAASARTGNPDLSVLATSVQLDAFTKVKENIDTMVAQKSLVIHHSRYTEKPQKNELAEKVVA